MSLSRVYGTTAQERKATLPGDDLVPVVHRVPLMAATIAMPPARTWAFLIQMGCDRAGFYSWDRLDNPGRRSAHSIRAEWQDLAVGDRVLAAADASVAFDVVTLEPRRALVLRLSLRLPSARAFDPAGRMPQAFVDATWGLYLSAASGGGTRLLSAMRMRGRPGWLYAPLHEAAVRPAHWIMQRKQFAELRRRATVTAGGGGW